MVSFDTPGLAASVKPIFLYFNGNFGDEGDASGTFSIFFMILSSLIWSLTTLLHILHNRSDLGSLESVVPIWNTSKVFLFT